jgi:hypothetical protein
MRAGTKRVQDSSSSRILEKETHFELGIKAVFLRNIQRYANCTNSKEILNRFKRKIKNRNYQILFSYLSYTRALPVCLHKYK